MKFFLLAMIVLGMTGCTHITHTSRAGIFLLTESIEPTRKAFIGEVGPRESNQPIVIGDIVFVANQVGDLIAMHRTEGYKFWELNKKVGRAEGSLTYGRSRILVGDTEGTLRAYHSNDGSVAWPEPIRIKAEWLSPASLYRDKIYIASSDDKIYCYNENGKEEWVYGETGDEKMRIRGKGKPVYFKGVSYQGFSNGYFAALEADTGKVVWRQKLKTRSRFYDISQTPYVDEEHVIVSTFDGRLYFLNRSTGKVEWQYNVGSYAGFLVDGNMLYFAGLDNHFYAIDRVNKKVVWRTPFDKGVGMTPVKADGYLVFTTTSDPIYLVDPANGKIVWKEYIGTGSLAGATSHPDGTFYVLSNYGNLFSFKILKNITLTKN